MSPSTNDGATLRTKTGGGTALNSSITRSTSFDVNVNSAMTLKEIGGRIFYVHNDNGLTYHFYNQSGVEITNQTVSGLANAYFYNIEEDKTATTDKFYAYCTNDGTPTGSILISSDSQWGKSGTSQGTTADTIGSGKTNSATLVNKLGSTSGTIWYWIKNSLNQVLKNGCNDWFIGSKVEMDKLRSSSTPAASTFNSDYLWSSVEYDEDMAWFWEYGDSYWFADTKSHTYQAVALRAF